MIYLNGVFRDEGPALDPSDRGFTLGDGVFETLAARDGAIEWFDAHWTRLETGAGALGFPVPVDGPTARTAMEELLARLGFSGTGSLAAIRCTVSRGPAGSGRGLEPPEQVTPTVLIQVVPIAASGEAVSAVVVSTVRNEYSLGSRIKSLSALDQIAAMREARAENAGEGILRNTQGRMACGARTNLFVVTGGVVVTPPVREGALPGIVRGALLEFLPQRGIEVIEAPVTETAMLAADELFATNSLLGVVGLRLPGGQAPGPMTRRVRHLWSAVRGLR